MGGVLFFCSKINIYLVHDYILFGGDSVKSFFPPRLNSFVRAPSSGDGSNAPRPAVSVPHLAGIGYVG